MREKQEDNAAHKGRRWIRSGLGVWQLKASDHLPHGVALELLEDGILDSRGTAYAIHQR